MSTTTGFNTTPLKTIGFGKLLKMRVQHVLRMSFALYVLLAEAFSERARNNQNHYGFFKKMHTFEVRSSLH